MVFDDDEADCYAVPSFSSDRYFRLAHSCADPHTATELLVAALERLRPLVRPVSAEATIGCVYRELAVPDTSIHLPQSFCFAYDGSIVESAVHGDPGRISVASLNPIYIGSAENAEVLAELTPETIGRWLVRARDRESPAPDTHEVAWTEVDFHTTRVRVHRRTRSGSPPHSIRLRTETGSIIEVPCTWDGVAGWVAGPTRRMRADLAHAPIILRAVLCGQLELTVTAAWSLWDEGTPDWAELRDAGRALLGDGWSMCSAGSPFGAIVGSSHQRSLIAGTARMSASVRS